MTSASAFDVFCCVRRLAACAGGVCCLHSTAVNSAAVEICARLYTAQCDLHTYWKTNVAPFAVLPTLQQPTFNRFSDQCQPAQVRLACPGGSETLSKLFNALG